MKILYAAGNCTNAQIQLARFLQAMHGSVHQIKIAAYKISSPKNQQIDWTLDCLLNIYKPEVFSLENDNLKIYFDQLQYYAPDLIISDLEYFTSYIASILNITIWQCSSSLINYALARNEKYNMGAFKYYAYAMNREIENNQRVLNLLANSSANLVYSHLGDVKCPPQLLEGFQWVRPYHRIGKSTVPCQHHLVAGLASNHKQLLGTLGRYHDAVAFLDGCVETYPNLQIKDIANQEEYFCNLKNSPIFVCQGQTSFLADAFYNGKYSYIYPNHRETETLVNSCLSQHLGLGSIITLQHEKFEELEVEPNHNDSIKSLSQRIEELCTTAH